MSETSSSAWRVGFCGTGPHSVQCANALQQHSEFEVIWVVTPPPKPVGRAKTLTPSPLENWAREQHLTVYHVPDKLSHLKPQLTTAPEVDFLVVVSFGYLLPSWLLELPQIAPINVHPSALPLYRGSAPGQFVIMYGEATSAVSIMEMNTKFDQGAVLAQLPLAISPLETQTSYYQKAFALAQEKLPQVLQQYALTRQSQPQSPPPANSPLARRLTRDDGYVEYPVLLAALAGTGLNWNKVQLGPMLQDVISDQPTLTPAQLLDRAVRALNPWPGVWTKVPKYKGKSNVRLKILAGRKHNDQYQPTRLQYEGETETTVGEIENRK